MKLIIAKQSGLDRIAYINANRIDSFHADINQYDNREETKIYFSDGKCVIEGDRTKEIAEYMSDDGDCGLLDLTKNMKETYWEKRRSRNGTAE